MTANYLKKNFDAEIKFPEQTKHRIPWQKQDYKI
jgi:hypothetical protein